MEGSFVSAWIIPVILAVTLHEAAHGWVAERFGDNTARRLGRVTFNPLKHIDPIGTLLVPGLLLLMHAPVLFGYAKPVPVNFHYLRPERWGGMLVAFAGPATNLLLAIAGAIGLKWSGVAGESLSWLQQNLLNAVMINCALAVFNMIPILPLDGGRVLRALLPGTLGDEYARTERYGMMLIFALLLLPPLLGWTTIMTTIAGINQWLVVHILSMIHI